MSYGERRGGYGGNRGFGGPKPVETGKEYDVQISEISRQGDGIARVQGFVIFVKRAKVGERAKIKITNVGSRFATAEKVGSGTAVAAGAEEPKQLAPPVAEKEKPELQDYKSEEPKP